MCVKVMKSPIVKQVEPSQGDIFKLLRYLRNKLYNKTVNSNESFEFDFLRKTQKYDFLDWEFPLTIENNSEVFLVKKVNNKMNYRHKKYKFKNSNNIVKRIVEFEKKYKFTKKVKNQQASVKTRNNLLPTKTSVKFYENYYFKNKSNTKIRKRKSMQVDKMFSRRKKHDLNTRQSNKNIVSSSKKNETISIYQNNLIHENNFFGNINKSIKCSIKNVNYFFCMDAIYNFDLVAKKLKNNMIERFILFINSKIENLKKLETMKNGLIKTSPTTKTVKKKRSVNQKKVIRRSTQHYYRLQNDFSSKKSFKKSAKNPQNVKRYLESENTKNLFETNKYMKVYSKDSSQRVKMPVSGLHGTSIALNDEDWHEIEVSRKNKHTQSITVDGHVFYDVTHNAR